MPHSETFVQGAAGSAMLADALHQRLNIRDSASTPAESAQEKIAMTKSRKKKKQQRKDGMKPADPAMKITRGFQTPVNSGAEESDTSAAATPVLAPKSSVTPSITSSPCLTPSALTRALSYHGLGEAMSREPSQLGSPLTHPDDAGDLMLESVSSLNAATDPVEAPRSRDFAAADTSSRPLFAGALEGGLTSNSAHHSPHRKMTANDFEPLKCLGKGTFGTVLLVKQHSTGKLFAQKQLKKATVGETERLIEQTKNERAILAQVKRHPFVVKMFYAFQDHHKLYLILEYAQGGELFHHLQMERSFSEEVAAFYVAEMVLALNHLHQNIGVVYRDLKPENCLLDAEGHLLLTDFGLSKITESGSTEDRCFSLTGTPDYMAPEVVAGKPYDAAVDWWSLGAVTYDLLTGAPPFAAANKTKIEQKILHGKANMPYYLGPDAKDFLTRLLRKEPKKRLGGNMPKDLALIKGHRFFRRIDWNALEQRELVAPIQPIVTDPAAAENFDTQFTQMAMSPVDASSALRGDADELFSGFSYVASSSLIESHIFV